MRKTNFKRFIIYFITILMLFYFIRYFVLDFQSELKTNRRTVLNNDSNVALVLKATLQINDRPVLITLVNDGYLNMVESWVCNTKHMGFHKQVIMITTSANATEKIKALSPHITVVVLNVDKSMNEHQVYSHVGYVKIMILRTQIQLALLQNDIELYSFECDSVFLANPLPTLRGHSEKHDIVFISNYKSPKAINGGFLYLFPTPATKATFEQLNRMMLKLSEKIKFEPSNKTIPTYENDQVYLSKLVLEKYAGLKSIILPFSVFPDGKWYEISEQNRKLTKPYLIHNNWIMGNKAKEERARKWGHWFLKEDGACDVDAVKKIIKF
ncbi:uncharacterized protein LOC127698327 [Mytilus californianus]|uniref:uncharacterized protein LOC127698327 n=1 Tax=Mytilus californianus TaxID=6549 RepID=UPI00224635E7|nr:uncharacterized protein LOC127698327 [Mytilus californianus]